MEDALMAWLLAGPVRNESSRFSRLLPKLGKWMTPKMNSEATPRASTATIAGMAAILFFHLVRELCCSLLTR